MTCQECHCDVRYELDDPTVEPFLEVTLCPKGKAILREIHQK
jgi:hypothetical protein